MWYPLAQFSITVQQGGIFFVQKHTNETFLDGGFFFKTFISELYTVFMYINRNACNQMRTVDAKIKVERSTHVSFLLDLNSNLRCLLSTILRWGYQFWSKF